MKYQILWHNDTYSLEKEVAGAIKDGWIPQGGVSLSGGKLMQAMVKINS